MAEMGFVGKLRGDCGTEQVLSPGLVSLEKKIKKRDWGAVVGGVFYVNTTFLSLHGVELHA